MSERFCFSEFIIMGTMFAVAIARCAPASLTLTLTLCLSVSPPPPPPPPLRALSLSLVSSTDARLMNEMERRPAIALLGGHRIM
eukprot:COSAG03_NODE_1571_length_3861_cov_2.247741_3_plen_84_part_00